MRFEVQPQALTSQAPVISRQAGQLAELAGGVRGLTGVAQGRFLQLWQQWQTSSKQLHQALAEIAVLMQRASGAYESNEQQIAASFSK